MKTPERKGSFRGGREKQPTLTGRSPGCVWGWVVFFLFLSFPLLSFFSFLAFFPRSSSTKTIEEEREEQEREHQRERPAPLERNLCQPFSLEPWEKAGA